MISRVSMSGVRAFAVALVCGGCAFAGDTAYQPLWLYDGAWKVTIGVNAPDALVNQCSITGRFFACQQTVNGKPGPLIVFVPAGTPGDYYSQAVTQEGWANGRGELHIEGSKWTYSSKTEQDGKTTYHRTTNVFTGKDRIHFEALESVDGKDWKVTMSGDEVRTGKGTGRP